MVDFQYADLFKKDSVDKQLQISFDSGTITNTELHQGQFELNESLCSEENLRFGSCESSSIKFKISNIFTPLTGKWLNVTETLDGNSDVSFSYGKYKVYSDKPTADRRYRDIVAYDAMHDILIADVAVWYNTILPDTNSTVTMKEFRDSFFSYFGIEQEEVTLVNDDIVVTKTIEPSQLSGKTVITAICEINGCFGHIGRNGKFQYIHLKEMVDGLYPADTLYPRDDLYPADPMNAERISKSHYISAEYEDYVTERITKLQVRQEENDIGCIYGTGDNCYIVQDNFLVYGKTSEELHTIAENLYSVISRVWYRPAHVEAKGNPCLEVGDGIRLSTKYAIVYTYILQRTLKGIQALRDSYDADGEQYQSEKVNSVRDDIIQLKGKTNKLIRTVEETRLEIKDIESGLDSKITQTAQKIETEVTRAKSAEESLGSRITQTAESISSEVTRATNAESNLSSKINQTAESISAEVQRATQAEGTLSSKITQTAESISSEVTRATNAESNLSSKINQTAESISAEVQRATQAEGTLSSKITQTAESISSEVTRATNAESNLSSKINQNAEQIELKVTKGNVSSQLSVETGQVKITSNRFVLESTNCSISANGTIKASNVDLTGKISASSGEIGGFRIGSSSLTSGSSGSLSSPYGVYIGTDGISFGKSSAAFKVTNAGVLTIDNSSGSITLGSSSAGRMMLDKDCISFGTSSYTTEITKDKIKIYNTYIEKDTVHCAKYAYANTYYTDINGDEIQLHGSSSSSYLQIKSGETIWASYSGTYNIKGDGGDVLIALSRNVVKVIPNNVVVGNGFSGSTVGFFGSDGAAKKNISAISSTSSATASSNATKINEILTALKAYNLIG